MFNIVLIVVLTFMKIDKNIINKVTMFLSATLLFQISYLSGIIKGKHGLINGLVIGISAGILSAIIHFIFAKGYYDILYIRLMIYILSACSGSVYGVNKKH